MRTFTLKLTGMFLVLWAVNAGATTRYVDLNSSNPTTPFTDWSTAATNIQDAVDAAVAGDLVLVTNGVYATGGRKFGASVTNRLIVPKPITVQSVNGAGATIIQGYQVPGSITGSNAIRCVYLTNSAILSGFTLTNGSTDTYTGTGIRDASGGGLVSVSANTMVVNCFFISNSASQSGGGAASGNFANCTFIGNTARPGAVTSFGGAVFGGVLSNCVFSGNFGYYGGAAYSSTLFGCVLSNNSAAGGGGACLGKLNNCLICSNAALSGAGAYGTGGGITLNNCTIVGNKGSDGTGGAEYGILNNCIVYYNSGININNNNNTGSQFNNCCTTPLPSGTGNFTNAPIFVNITGGDFHLSSNSPCINAGKNSYATSITDLDGNPRIVGGTVDIGAYEYQSPSSVLSYAWAQQYGLPTDGSADFADTDGDGLNNYSEWIAGTVPTNSASVLAMNAPTNNAPGLKVSWQSVSGKTYFLQRSTNLLTQPAFSSIQSNLVGAASTTTYPDTSATNGGPYFYRVGVQ